MSPRTEQQFEQIREERKKQIMDVALSLIAAEGFGKVSISKIAKEAGISKGLMYNYFKSKEELIIEVMYEGINVMVGNFASKLNKDISKEDMHNYIEESFKVLQNNIAFFRMYFMVMAQPEVLKIVQPGIMSKLGSIMQAMTIYFSKYGYEDPEAEMRVFAALIDGVGLHFVLDPENYPVENVKKILHRMYT